MIVFPIIFLLSFLGVVIIIFSHWGELKIKANEAHLSGHKINFASIMNKAELAAKVWWHERMKNYLILSLENIVGHVRIIILKLEKSLFNLARRLRNLAGKN